MKKSFFLIFLFFSTLLLLQSAGISLDEEPKPLEREWSGYLTQGKGGLAIKYNLRFQIKQEGKKIKGISTIRLIDQPDIYGVMEFSGEMQNERIIYRESKILKQNISDSAYWCIKAAKLKYQIINNKEILAGRWDGCGFTSEKDIIYLEKILM